MEIAKQLINGTPKLGLDSLPGPQKGDLINITLNYKFIFQLTPGTEWERVAKLCDFNPKTARNTKDIGRMRSVILQLKQEGNSPTVPHGV